MMQQGFSRKHSVLLRVQRRLFHTLQGIKNRNCWVPSDLASLHFFSLCLTELNFVGRRQGVAVASRCIRW